MQAVQEHPRGLGTPPPVIPMEAAGIAARGLNLRGREALIATPEGWSRGFRIASEPYRHPGRTGLWVSIITEGAWHLWAVVGTTPTPEPHALENVWVL